MRRYSTANLKIMVRYDTEEEMRSLERKPDELRWGYDKRKSAVIQQRSDSKEFLLVGIALDIKRPQNTRMTMKRPEWIGTTWSL